MEKTAATYLSSTVVGFDSYTFSHLFFVPFFHRFRGGFVFATGVSGSCLCSRQVFMEFVVGVMFSLGSWVFFALTVYLPSWRVVRVVRVFRQCFRVRHLFPHHSKGLGSQVILGLWSWLWIRFELWFRFGVTFVVCGSFHGAVLLPSDLGHVFRFVV